MGPIFEILPQLLRGLSVTLSVLIAAVLIAYLVAFITGFAKLSKNKTVFRVTTAFVEFFRGTSLIVQLFWLYYAIPMLLGIQLGSNWWAGVIAIGLNYGAYMSEVVRTSILAIDKGQDEAGTALNFSKFKKMMFIMVPQAIRMMIPDFGSYTIQIMKATPLVSLIGLRDILYYGDILRNTNLSLSPLIYLMILLIYFVIALPIIFITKKSEVLAKKGVAN